MDADADAGTARAVVVPLLGLLLMSATAASVGAEVDAGTTAERGVTTADAAVPLLGLLLAAAAAAVPPAGLPAPLAGLL